MSISLLPWTPPETGKPPSIGGKPEPLLPEPFSPLPGTYPAAVLSALRVGSGTPERHEVVSGGEADDGIETVDIVVNGDVTIVGLGSFDMSAVSVGMCKGDVKDDAVVVAV